MKLLFDGKYAPITTAISFLEEDNLAKVMDAYHRFFEEGAKLREKTVGKDDKIQYTQQAISGNLETALQALLPLGVPSANKELFVPTRSGWIAHFANYARPLPSSLNLRLGIKEGLNCRALYVSAEPPIGQYLNQLVFELYAPHDLYYSQIVRSIRFEYDINLMFKTQGEVLPFEDTEKYKARHRRDRFSFEMLQSYAQALGVSPFDEDFYMPEGSQAMLIETTNLPYFSTISLEDAQKRLRLQWGQSE